MINKFFSSLLVALIIVGAVGFLGGNVAEAQVATFPSGCASGLGYSETTGLPCNGTSTATQRYMAGCENTALGYSATTGLPCSGGSVAIQWLSGCSSSTIGYSSITGEPCNGTDVATPVVIPSIGGAPGLPATGAGGYAMWNIILLSLSALMAIAGSAYL